MIIEFKILISMSIFFHQFNNVFVCIKKILLGFLHSPPCPI